MKLNLIVPALALIALLALSAFAQVGKIEGEVKKKGTGEPIVGAEVQIHRNDIKWSANLKTDKKGKYIHAGIQFGGTYTLIVGADGYRPDVILNVKPEQQGLNFELDSGDGKRLTFEEVKAMSGKGGSGGVASTAAPANSAADKKAKEEFEKKSAEVKKKNEKIESDNKAMQTSLETGKQLFNNKDYNGAIAEFDKGITIDAEQNVFWYFKGLSQYNRGVGKLNDSIKDAANAQTLRDSAKADFTDATANATKAISLLQASIGTDPAKQTANKGNLAGYMKVKADAEMLLGQRFFDAAMADAANKDYNEVAKLTDDPVAKMKLLFLGAETLRVAGATPAALEAYKAMITIDPNYAEAYYGMGLAYFNDEKTFQDGANYLQFFIEKAPATDSRVAEAKGVIEQMKIKPSKDALNVMKKEAGAKPAATKKKN